MSFVEIEKINRGWVRIHEKGLTISKDIREKHFKNKKVKIFFDEDNLLLGLKPSAEGYKMSNYGFIKCAKLPNIGTGEHRAVWSSEKNMIILDLKTDE